MFSKVLIFISAMAFSMGVFAEPVNVNKGTVEEISMALNGIGPSKAQAISSYCQETTCTKPEDLLNIKGIGEKTLEKIKADLLF